MFEVASFLGWTVVWGFVIVMLNFCLKFVNKKIISKLPNDKKQLKSIYVKIMKVFIKLHKPVGILISLIIIVHFALMFTFVQLSPTGIIALCLILCTFLLGLYGAFINKNYKAIWLKIHRISAFLLVLAIFVHVFL